MNIVHSTSFAVAILLSVTSIGPSQVLAQEAVGSSRAAIKAETRRAQQNHQLVPAGDSASLVTSPTTLSTKTRRQRQEETARARAASELLPAGEAGSFARNAHSSDARSTRTRAQRRAETLEAARGKKLIPAGEAAALK